jgi:hypothetical protein
MLSRRNVLTALLLTAPGMAAAQDPQASPPPPAPAKDDGVIRIPIQVRHNQPWTEVWINGKGPFRFTIDTGDLGGYSIDPKTAQSLGLAHAFATNIAGVTGSARGEAYQAGEVIIGGVLRDNGRVFTPEAAAGFTVGLLPVQLLQLLPCDLDFGEGELRLYQAARPSREGWERLRSPPRDRSVRTGFVVDVTLDDEPYRLLLDSGDQEGVTIAASAVRRRGLWNRYPQWIESRGRGVVEVARARTVRLKSLKLGTTEMPNPVVSLIDPSAHDAFEGVDGLIGMETMRRFAFSFDADQNGIWIKPNGALHQPFRYNRSGLSAHVRDGHFEVVATKPDSPAAKAGLAPGDVLYKVGPDFLWRLQDGPGTVLEFEMERAGQRQPVKLILADLI